MNPQNLKESEKDFIQERVIPPPWVYPHHLYFPEGKEISLLELWSILLKRKWQILITIGLVTSFSLIFSLILPQKFTSKVTLMPITTEKGGGYSNLAAQMSAVPIIGGQLGSLSEKFGGGKSKELVNILWSRTLTEEIIRRYDLMKVIFADRYDPKTETFHAGFPEFLKPAPVMEDGVKVFQEKFFDVLLEKKSGLIKIKVTMKDPVLAEKVANGMIVALQDFINNNDITIQKRNRIFIEGQLVKNRENLLNAGKELNQFYGKNKISSVHPEIDVDVGNYQLQSKPLAEFRDELKSSQVPTKIKAMEVIESKVQGVPGQVYLEYLDFKRELLARVYSLLTQQHELAKIEESKEDLAFQVLDKAQVMVRASSPKLFLNIAIGFASGVFLAFFIAFFREFIAREKAKEKHWV